MPLHQRLRWCLDNRPELTQRGWSIAAGMSDRYVSTVIAKARQTGGVSMEYKTASALARVAGVSARWLATGEGEPAERDTPAPQPATPRLEPATETAPESRESPLPRHPHQDHAILDAALGMAFESSRHAVEDIFTVRQIMQGTDLRAVSVPGLVEAARAWLDASAKLRAEGAPVSAQALLLKSTLPG